MNPRLRLPDHIDTLLLDLDGTLLDLAFDTHFWHEVVAGSTTAHARHVRQRGRWIGQEIRPAAALGRRHAQLVQPRLLVAHAGTGPVGHQERTRLAHRLAARRTGFLHRQRAAGTPAGAGHQPRIPRTLRIKDEKVSIRPLLDAVYSSHQFGAREGARPSSGCGCVGPNPSIRPAQRSSMTARKAGRRAAVQASIRDCGDRSRLQSSAAYAATGVRACAAVAAID